jgi:hypothetical protein
LQNLERGVVEAMIIKAESRRRLRIKKLLSYQIGIFTGRCSSVNVSKDIINIIIYYNRVNCNWIKIQILSI